MKLPNGQAKQIHNVMYVPSIKKNLISSFTIVDNDLKVEFVKSWCVVKDIRYRYRVVSICTRVGGLYKLDVTMNNHLALASSTMSTKELWNQRYGNLNHNDLMLMKRRKMVERFPIMKNNYIECEACALGQQHREEFPIHKKKRKT